MSSGAAHPVREKERIVQLDVLRGFALLGILPMNIQYFSMAGAAYFNPTAYGDFTGANYWVWLLCHLFADLKFMSIFCMLFGAGILLMTSRAEAADHRPAILHFRRMGWLILFGMLHAYFLWAGDILYDYGMCGLVVFFFRKLRPRTLIIIGLIVFSVTPVIMIVSGRALAHAPEALQALREDLWQPMPQGVAEELAGYRGGWRAEIQQRFGEAVNLETTYFIMWAFWREAGLMLIGMALFKLGFFDGRLSPRVYWTMIAMGLCIGIPVTLYGTLQDFARGWEFRYS